MNIKYDLEKWYMDQLCTMAHLFCGSDGPPDSLHLQNSSFANSRSVADPDHLVTGGDNRARSQGFEKKRGSGRFQGGR